MSKNKKLKVIDLFWGVGGLSYGFAHDDNFEIVAANEILPNMAKAYSLFLIIWILLEKHSNFVQQTPPPASV